MMKKTFAFALLLCMCSLSPQKNKIKIFIASDSTAANKEIKAYPETGWGMPFAYFFDSTTTVDNRAKNGRSTKSFIAEGLWQKLIDDVHEGDYVLIQFGHNDESKDKGERYSTPDEYKANLGRFITETRNKKANPILLTPVSRRQFDSAGHVRQTHATYSPLVREVAKQYNVPLIDLDELSRALYEKLGPENSKLLFLQLEPGEHPNYPEGKNDNTHFNELGARKIAQLVLADLRRQNILTDRIVKPPTK